MEYTVPSTDTLTVIASIAIAIAGFSGVVVALTGRTTESFGKSERLNLRILLQVSAFALLFSLIPLILHRPYPPETAWRVSMLLYGAVHILDSGFFVLRSSSAELSLTQRYAPRIGMAIAVGQILLGIMGSAMTIEVAYLVVLLWHLAIAGMGFMNLIFASRDKTNA